MPPKRKSDGGGGGGTPRSSHRKTKKNRKYSGSDHERSNSDLDEGNGFDKSKLQKAFKFDFEELMRDPTFNHPEFVQTMEPEDLNLEFFENEGLDNPIHFRCDPTKIGMKLPPSTFSVNDVLELVGGNRMIEVVEVQNQGSVKMSLQEFVDFYNTPKEKRTTLYNVLSLEFSLTPLEDLVKSPSLVRQIDWVGNKWPDALRQRWISFIGRDKKHYLPHHTFPKVQNYCLMSVSKCYTDFHIDFSGTSVWYHVLRGRKVFWLIPPTETNFFIYQEFIKTVGDNAFFGKSVEKCHVAILEPGDTMLIPSGWIHAVYTPDDSLVFGGNFLHSQSIKTQIRVYQVENKLNITRKFRLPYNEELLMYVVADYVKTWTGREYVRPLRIEEARMDYVGEKWQAAGGHLRKIVYSDYETGVELPNDMVGEEQTSKDEVKVIAMHAENTIFDSVMVSKMALLSNTGLEPEDDEDQKCVESKEEMEARRDAEIEELARNNPLIFYKNSKHDFVRNRCVPDHKLPIGHEPPICFITEEISRISPRLLDELEALGTYLRRKTKVEVSEGICQPASLLNAFNTVLRKRRSDLEGKTFQRPYIMPRRYTRAAIETGEYSGFPGTNDTPNDYGFTSRFKVEDFPDELLEAERDEAMALPQQPSSGPLEYIPTPKVKKEEENQEEELKEEEEEEEEDQEEEDDVPEEPEDDEEEEEEDEEYNEEEYVPSARVTRRSSQRKSTSGKPKKEEVTAEEKKDEETPKKEKKEKKVKVDSKKDKKTKEQKKRELERRKLDSELDAELRAAHGGGSAKSKKKKPEKPAYVGGLPTSSIQTDPVVSNPYNYDPMMEMVKLGTGQLKSAYRKTRNNVELRIEKNLYKLEPKRGSRDDDEGRESSDEPEGYPAYTPISRPNNQPILFDYSGQDNFDDTHQLPSKRAKIEPISVDTVETPPSKKRETREHRPSPVSQYTPSPTVATPKVATPKVITPTPVVNNKPKITSPAVMFSPSSHSESSKVQHLERRSSDANPAMRKGIYMPSMSRQDKMLAEVSSAASSRHSSISSERRPSFIPQLSTSSRHPSSDAAATYTPTVITTPARSSWLPNTSNISRHSTTDDDSLIDVVNDTPVEVPRAITPPPIHLADLTRDYTNGRRSQNDDGKKPKIPAKEAMAELKTLVSKLNNLNES